LLLVAGCALALSGGLAALLIHLTPAVAVGSRWRFPPAFAVSTLLLAGGSASLVRAVHQVRLERQRAFRRSLLFALAAGILFVGVQSWGLWWLAGQQNAESAQTGPNAFVLVFAVLHAIHFTVALLFLAWVTLRALADRYDHEYYWGVSLCGYLWHALGIVWLVILGVLLISVATLVESPFS
jgi:heme/copper-type cytochrome/quinol oxidase subunit 3